MFVIHLSVHNQLLFLLLPLCCGIVGIGVKEVQNNMYADVLLLNYCSVIVRKISTLSGQIFTFIP